MMYYAYTLPHDFKRFRFNIKLKLMLLEYSLLFLPLHLVAVACYHNAAVVHDASSPTHFAIAPPTANRSAVHAIAHDISAYQYWYTCSNIANEDCKYSRQYI